MLILIATTLDLRIIDFTRMETYAKKSKLAMLIAGSTIKKVHWFFLLLVTRNLLCFWCFAAGWLINVCFLLMRCNTYKRVIVKICDWIFMSIFHFRKDVTVFGFLRFLSSYLFICIRRNWPFNSACRVIVVEDKYQTLAAIPFKVEINSCSKSLPLSAYEKDLVEFKFLYIFYLKYCIMLSNASLLNIIALLL